VEALRRVDPAIILTAPPADYIADHEMTSLLVRDACFGATCANYTTRQWSPAAPLSKIPHLYFVDPLEGRDREGRAVLPDFHVDVSRVFEKKRQMLACHASQRNWLLRQHGIDEYLEVMARWGAGRGGEIGVAQAEGFRQYRGHPYPQDNLLLQLLGQNGRGKPTTGAVPV
jgi:N-acetylglucosamine malate deacetylase 1